MQRRVWALIICLTAMNIVLLTRLWYVGTQSALASPISQSSATATPTPYDASTKQAVATPRPLTIEEHTLLAEFAYANLAWNYPEWLVGLDPHGTLLWEVPLQDAILHRVNFHGADLMGADLSRANMTAADFSETVLLGANLSEAYVASSNFEGACLARANLSNATLINLDFSSSNLSDANLAGAKYDGVAWPSDFGPEAAGAVPME